VLSTHAVTAEATPPIFLRGRALRGTKRFVGGTHRTVAPEETLERIRPHLRTAGITRLADVTGLDRVGVSTALAYRPNSPTLSNSSGKGFTLTAALVSGAMEGIELYHAENPRLPRHRARYVDLERQELVIPAERLQLARGSLFNPRHTETWVSGWDLVTQRAIWVPYLQAVLALDPDSPRRWRPFEVGSNGLASGNVMIEAISAALLEVVERDAVACRAVAGRHSLLGQPRVALETVRFPLVNDLKERLGKVDLGLVLYDQTVDTGIPVYMASIYERRDRHVGRYSGYGAHLDPEIAMVRAITEAVQSRLVYIAGSRDDYFRHDYLAHRMSDGAMEVERLERQAATVDAGGLRSRATPTFEGDVAVLIERLRAVGVEHVIAVDLTHEELGLPVVRVIVPGLEGCSLVPSYTPGRRAREQARRGVEAGA
jgi:ribosomal protein S12 methylthiotransferase accessory factor